MSKSWQIDCGSDGIILFGPQSSRYPFAIAPELGDPDRETQDSSLPGVDGTFFGIDTTAGQTIAFGLTAVGETDEEARQLYAALRRVWRADSIRSTPGAMAKLTHPSGRSTFGRPRRFTPAFYPDAAGAVGATLDFATSDDLWYDEPDYIRVPLAVSQSGGLVEPLVEPLVAYGSTTAANTFTVKGEVPTWPVITIEGPIVNPTVEVTGRFRFTAATSLRYDETLVIDTRPGRQSVLRNGTQIAALTRSSTLLTDASLPPGNYTLLLSGSSSSGAPTARADWLAAYPTP
ncbi:hypothetical protein EDF51_106164 [Curtobacterium sp. PhB25]|uniref:hypothetical protein n=1 Tax=Curtobacterium sp. PhB25 TaxID=2485205 RepID=UPI001066DEC3|nr:hypothetical protein [Curtobacterium sp. PhB25]TDW69180.1 hypothetical protein EDF51_106164 [Curtobacterium sp. PhB25]